MATNVKKSSIPLIIPTLFFTAAFLLGMTVTIAAHNSTWAYVMNHPNIWPEVIGKGFGTGGLLLPIVHLIIASFFKSQRNATARRKIILGWSIVLLVLQGFLYF